MWRAVMSLIRSILYRRSTLITIGIGIICLIFAFHYINTLCLTAKIRAIGSMELDINSGELNFKKKPLVNHIQGGNSLEGTLGNIWSKPWGGCIDDFSDGKLSVKCKGSAELSIMQSSLQKHSTNEYSTDCYQVMWRSLSDEFTPMDCYNTPAGHHWYGGAEVIHDRWPTDEHNMKMQHFLSNDIGMIKDGYGGVMERYWLTSTGITLTVHEEVPLHVSVSKGRICIKAQYTDSWYQMPPGNSVPILNYTICSSHNILEAHLHITGTQFKTSQHPPHHSLFEKPIWSTWAKYRKRVNQTNVLYYTSLIKNHGFEGCQIEIDDGYTKSYGDPVFDPVKFPQPVDMSKQLMDSGFKVATWIVPFTNNDSSFYEEAVSKNYFITSRDGKKPPGQEHLIDWWQGTGGLADLTNPAAIQWFKRRLESLKSQGVSAFKFDAGECNFLPKDFKSFKPLYNPNQYGQLYAKFMHELTGNRMIEVRVGYKTQHLPVMVRMMDKDSSWGYSRGIQTLIPSALVFGLLGYPYVLPDMVGGNGYAGEVKTLPDKELYLRWLAATILLPFIQFSIPPWDFDAETVSMVHDLLNIRKAHIEDIKHAASSSANTAYPMIRPLWWIDPENAASFSIDSEFILGTNLLVAPVLHKGEMRRDVYLPRGKWTDTRTRKVYVGRTTLYNYPVKLNELPIFKLIGS